jgi:hypothetical protein
MSATLDFTVNEANALSVMPLSRIPEKNIHVWHLRDDNSSIKHHFTWADIRDVHSKHLYNDRDSCKDALMGSYPP